MGDARWTCVPDLENFFLFPIHLNVSLHFLHHLIIISLSTAKSLRAFIFYDVVSDYDEPFVSISMKTPNTNNDNDNVNHSTNDLKLSLRLFF